MKKVRAKKEKLSEEERLMKEAISKKTVEELLEYFSSLDKD